MSKKENHTPKKDSAKSGFSLKYLTKEGFRNVRTHKLMSIASITVMLCCLLLMGCAYLIYINVQAVIDKVGKQNVIMVFIQDDATDSEEQKLLSDLKNTSNINDISFVSKEQSYQQILYDMGNQKEVMSGINSDFLPDAYKVTIKDMSLFSSTVAKIKTYDNVLSVRENSELADKLNKIQNQVSLLGVAVTLILLIVSVFIISITVRITMYSRSLEISIMKAVGATNSFIRWPFIIEGVVLGFIAAVIGFGVMFGLYYGAEKIFADMFSILGTATVDFKKTMIVIAIAFVVLSVITGAVGSSISLSRYLKEHGKVVDDAN